MKAKVTMAISIAFTALILTMVMFTQFKTVDETDITAIETMRETELRSELASWKAKYEEIEAKIDENENRINEYKAELENDENASTILENEVKEAESYLGKTNLQGEGIVVTLKDNDTRDIIHSDLLDLINELNIAGAEAISINDERIVSTSEIVLVNNTMILVNTKRVAGPYVVKAIGDKQYLQSALTIKDGYVDLIKSDGKDIEYYVDDNIVIPAYDGEQVLEQAKEYIEEEEEVKK